jgi:hypothetical protein
MINTFDLEVRKDTSSENTRHSVTDTMDQQLSVNFARAHGLEVQSRASVHRCISEGSERFK